MPAFQRARSTPAEKPGQEQGWRTSRQQTAPGLLPWILAVIVVAIFALGFHFLYD